MFMMMKNKTVRAQRGLSLVELLVGVVIGLFIVGGAAYFATNYSTENRRLLLEARLTQDMRAAMDIVTRDLRRAGYWQHAASGISANGVAPAVSYESTNFAVFTPASGAASSTVSYAYDKSASAAATDDDKFAFTLGTDKVLRTTIGTVASQPLTDSNTTLVNTFSVESFSEPMSVTCAASCAGPSCPTVQVRQFVVTISASSAIDTTIARTLKNHVRVRNDYVTGVCP